MALKCFLTLYTLIGSLYTGQYSCLTHIYSVFTLIVHILMLRVISTPPVNHLWVANQMAEVVLTTLATPLAPPLLSFYHARF